MKTYMEEIREMNKEDEMYLRNDLIWAEMARRKKQFHPNERWQEIKLWGLFGWGSVSRLLDKGLLITSMKKENHTIWVWPSETAYHKYIEPLLKHSIEELLFMAGWTD